MSLKLSVVFFTYNRSGYLARAISEFTKNCNLNRDSYELIISDDGSNDLHKEQLLQIQKDFGVEKVIFNDHKGMGNNFNIGLQAAEAKFVLHLEDDWELQPSCGNLLSRSLSFMIHNPDVDMVRLASLNGIDPLTGLENFGEGFHRLKSSLTNYSNDPHLKRKDFHKFLHWYDSDCTADECEQIFQEKIDHYSLKVCWAGSAFNHFGCISTNGFVWENLNDIHEILYNSSLNRDSLLVMAQAAMKSNDLFTARHALEKFEATGECDSQVLQSLEVVREICQLTECAG